MQFTKLVSLVLALLVLTRVLFFSGSTTAARENEIRPPNVLDYVKRPERQLDVHKHAFLQSRVGRDERPDLMSSVVRNGVADFWSRFQLPLCVAVCPCPRTNAGSFA